MVMELTRIAEIAKEKSNQKITSLAGMINKDSLVLAHQEMSRKKLLE